MNIVDKEKPRDQAFNELAEALIGAIGDALSIQDRDFKILYQNTILKELTGDRTGEYCYRVYEQKDAVCDGCFLAAAFGDSKIHRGERVCSFPGRGTQHVEITASAVRNADGEIIAGIEIIRNITERKQTEEKVKESEGMFKALAEKSLVGVYLVQDGVFRYVNPRLAEVFGYAADELIDRRGPKDVVFAEDWPMVEENMRKRLSGETDSIDYLFRGLTKDGEILDLEGHGSLTLYKGRRSIIGTLLDITDRKRAEMAIRANERRYKCLIESVTDYIYTVFVEDGQPTGTSHGPGCEAVTGYSTEDYDVDPYLWFRMIHQDDKDLVLEQAARILSGNSVLPVEHRIIHKDGSIRWVKNKPVSRYDEKGRLIAYEGLISDITERRRLEDQLRQAQKMEAVGQLAGGIAHDFNNILTAIMGYANLLQMKINVDDPLNRYIAEILASSERAADLIQGILAFSRKQILNPKPVDINDVIEKMKELLSRTISEDIELEALLNDQTLTVMVDRGQMEQVLMNLCTNARDAMPTGGMLTIETASMEMTEEFVQNHGYGAKGRYARISVSDTGVGIDEETKRKIFEPFFTTKEVGKGTGLGLAVVYGIVKQHDGHINVYSEKGTGSTFRIYLPLLESAKIEKSGPAASLVPSGTGERILIAEDNRQVRDLTRHVLEEHGYKVVEAVDGDDAIGKFRESPDLIDLAILDVVMPKKGGKEAYEAMRRIRPDIKVFFVSGYPKNIVNSRGILEDDVEVILKPLIPKDLLRKVRQVLSGQG
ncbi:MAG: PAS domain S-box protein [Thermodesulfovibrionales bacterium]